MCLSGVMFKCLSVCIVSLPGIDIIDSLYLVGQTSTRGWLGQVGVIVNTTRDTAFRLLAQPLW